MGPASRSKESAVHPLPAFSRRLLPVALLAAVVALVAAHSGADAAPGPHAAKASCSARGLPPGAPQTNVPAAVDDMRMRLMAAARRCDYRRLDRLGDAVGEGVAFSFGAERSARR